MKTLFSQTLELIASRDELLAHQIPDHLLDAWIIGIADRPKEEYDFDRDFIVNIFNEIYEGYKESQGINPAEDDHDRVDCRHYFESLLKSERHRRDKNIDTAISIDPFVFIMLRLLSVDR